MSLDLLERPTRLDSAESLSTHEERTLARQIRRGDRQAVERLVLANLGLVGMIARGYLGYGLSLDDLKQEGIRGVIHACREFDPETHDVRFSTYAAYSIRNAIHQAIAASGSMIRLPDHMIRLRSKYRRTVGDLHSEEFESAGKAGLNLPAPGRGTNEEIAARMGISLDTLDLVRQTEIEQVHIQSETDEGDSISFEETVADDSQPLFDLETIEELDCLREGIDLLDEHEAWVIRQRFGLASSPSDRSLSPPKSVHWIARTYEVPLRIVRQSEETAMMKLRDHMRRRVGDDGE
jgi:RNA polymerase primary sigma factor